ncbi:hypothetical protein WJX74_001838 [Apatococcus lobatus]|uniref:Uncharacterized protein n=1 Tax=Apatococcus lobatus TaxID=904363 RepID=A0AAW1Q2J7_9CHLO
MQTATLQAANTDASADATAMTIAIVHRRGPLQEDGQVQDLLHPDPAEYHPTKAELEAGAAVLGAACQEACHYAPLDHHLLVTTSEEAANNHLAQIRAAIAQSMRFSLSQTALTDVPVDAMSQSRVVTAQLK